MDPREILKKFSKKSKVPEPISSEKNRSRHVTGSKHIGLGQGCLSPFGC